MPETNGTKLRVISGRESGKLSLNSNYGLVSMQLFLSPDFNIRSLRRKPKTAAQKIRELRDKFQSHQLTPIGRILETLIPTSLFDEHRTIPVTIGTCL